MSVAAFTERENLHDQQENVPLQNAKFLTLEKIIDGKTVVEGTVVYEGQSFEVRFSKCNRGADFKKGNLLPPPGADSNRQKELIFIEVRNNNNDIIYEVFLSRWQPEASVFYAGNVHFQPEDFVDAIIATLQPHEEILDENSLTSIIAASFRKKLLDRLESFLRAYEDLKTVVNLFRS